jgi:hypothetical protein
VVVPPKELRPSISEDEELAELGCLLEINVGEALGMGLAEVCRRWFSSMSNAATALESCEIIERGGEESHWPAVQPVVGHWGNIIDPLDTMWVHPDGMPYAHDEPSIPREEGGSPNSMDAEFEEGGLMSGLIIQMYMPI